jgi:hypothetical protein
LIYIIVVRVHAASDYSTRHVMVSRIAQAHRSPGIG